jgi:hypothetical protein
MVAKNSVLMSLCGAMALFFSFSLLYVYRNQIALQAQLEQSQSKMTFAPINQTSPHIAENVITSSQLWRPVQDRVRDTVVQLFVQLSAVDLLEPYKTPQQGSACGSGFFINDEGYLITNDGEIVGEIEDFEEKSLTEDNKFSYGKIKKFRLTERGREILNHPSNKNQSISLEKFKIILFEEYTPENTENLDEISLYSPDGGKIIISDELEINNSTKKYREEIFRRRPENIIKKD